MMESISETTKVGVLGGGAWGTALAIHCARMGHDTLLWARCPATVTAINTTHENTCYLPGHPCPPGLVASSNLEEVIGRSEVLLLVVPTQYIADTLGPVAHLLQPHQILVNCSKGISTQTLETVDELLERLVPEAFRGRMAYLSGPSFAAEVAAGQPTAVTVAARDEQLAARVQALLSNSRFRCYRSTDVTGVELGGALKNVLAIACGVSDGLGFGHNGRAALITRGLYEITKLAVARGANPLTMAGLAGMGDLVLTCTGDLSRNRTVGLRLGRGERLGDIKASMGGAVAEGVPTAVAIHNLARRLGVECPIMEGIHRVIHEGANAREVVAEVMSRDLKPEVESHIIRGAGFAISAASTPYTASASNSLTNIAALLPPGARASDGGALSARTSLEFSRVSASVPVTLPPPGPSVPVAHLGGGGVQQSQLQEEQQHRTEPEAPSSPKPPAPSPSVASQERRGEQEEEQEKEEKPQEKGGQKEQQQQPKQRQRQGRAEVSELLAAASLGAAAALAAVAVTSSWRGRSLF